MKQSRSLSTIDNISCPCCGTEYKVSSVVEYGCDTPHVPDRVDINDKISHAVAFVLYAASVLFDYFSSEEYSFLTVLFSFLFLSIFLYPLLWFFVRLLSDFVL